MMSTVFFVSTLLIITAQHDSNARLIGTRWSSSSNKQHVSTLAVWKIAEAGPVSSKDSDTNDKKMQQQQKQQQQGSANSRPILTGSRLFAGATLSFDVHNHESSGDACYDCCCDRNVVCNSPHDKSEGNCHRNACKDGTTCQSEGYTCPSYDCDLLMW